MRKVLALFGTMALTAAGGCACSHRCSGNARAERDCQAPQQRVTQAPVHYADPSLVGERGPDGPSGPVGERGATGQTGAPGYAAAGARGGPGPTGSTGEQGPTGATGASGAVVRGRTGAQGAAGEAGEQGASGQMGARGDSAAGFAGASGTQGPAGPAGETGPTGVRGATLEGPTGPAGRSGPAGAQGATGYAGAQGSTTAGVAGATGPTGARGPQGPKGEIGAQGRVGVVAGWTSYRDFSFQYESCEIQDSERGRLTEVATYMNKNPSLQIGIDGTMNQRGTDPQNQDLCDRRVKAIRDGLVAAGVPTHKISVGAYGDVELRRDRRVEVLIATAK